MATNRNTAEASLSSIMLELPSLLFRNKHAPFDVERFRQHPSPPSQNMQSSHGAVDTAARRDTARTHQGSLSPPPNSYPSNPTSESHRLAIPSSHYTGGPARRCARPTPPRRRPPRSRTWRTPCTPRGFPRRHSSGAASTPRAPRRRPPARRPTLRRWGCRARWRAARRRTSAGRRQAGPARRRCGRPT
jgi:hypothetical protein